jgi:YD repeat-containing protein
MRPPYSRTSTASRKTSETNADGGVITTSYDPAGNVTLLLDPRSQGSTNTYDNANRLLTKAYTDGNLFTFTYDNIGNRLTSASSYGTYASTFTARNQLASLAEPGGKSVTYTYDQAMRRTAMNSYGEGLFTYVYDAAQPPDPSDQPQREHHHHDVRWAGAPGATGELQRRRDHPDLRRGRQYLADHQQRPVLAGVAVDVLLQ